jgi:hypothetical protein
MAWKKSEASALADFSTFAQGAGAKYFFAKFENFGMLL